MKAISRVLLVGLFLFFISYGSVAAPLPAQWRNPLPQGNNLYGVTYANGMYVAVGAYGTVVISYDGTNWQAEPAPTSALLYAVAGGGGAFIIAGAQGTILLSHDGANWSSAAAPTTNDFVHVAYGAGVFVLADREGFIYCSPNGANWTKTFSTFPIESIAFGNGLFIGIKGSDGYGVSSGRLAASPDGTHWTASSTPPPNGPVYYLQPQEIAFGNGLFYVSGWYAYNEFGGVLGSFTTYILTSADGVQWSCPFTTSGTGFQSLAAGGGFLTAEYSPEDYDTSSYIFFGPADGSNLVQSSSLPEPVSAQTFGSPGFVAVGKSDLIGFSSDATNWTDVGQTSDGVVAGLAVSSNVAVASLASANVSDLLVASNDGPFLAVSPAVSTTMYDVAVHNGRFISVGAGGAVKVSSDGLNWSARSSSTTSDLHRVSWLSGSFVSVGNAGTIITSPTGDAWTLRVSGTASSLNGLAAAPGQFVVVGAGGNLVTSPDLVDWTAQYSTVTNDLCSVACGHGLFVAVGEAGAIISSPDGTNWSAQASGVSRHLQTIIFDRGLFLAVGDQGLVLSSPDGATWASHYLASPINLYAISPNGNSYLIGGDFGGLADGDNGFILQIPALIAPGLSQPVFRSQGFGFIFSGATGQTYTLQSSTDFSQWTPVYSFTNVSGVTNLSDVSVSNTGNRFYRIIPH